VRKAEEGEFHAFVAARMDRWRRTAYLMCLDWHTADDVVSITVAKLFRNWRKVAAADNRDAYAQRVLSRSWLDEQGRASRREQPQAELPDVAWSVPEQITDRQALARLLTSLGPRQRAVVVLRFYLGYSVQETAEMLNVSEGTVKSQSARGLETLRTAATAHGN
jgi:RNA polymerase sigma-70 factor (sigma-E family)